jgi:hypothetical protein
MTTPTSSTTAHGQALVAKAPSLLHTHLAEYASKATGLAIDAKTVQVILGLHGEFQKSDAWKQVKAADAKARQDAAKKQMRDKRTTKVQKVTEPDARPDDSHLQYKVWSDEMVESENGDLTWAMLPVEPLKTGGQLYDVVERVNDASDLQVHKKGCADVGQYRKQKGIYHVRTVRAHDPIHVAYVEISEINQSNGEGTMGYDIDSVDILPCAHEKRATPTRKAPVKKAVSMDVTDAAVAAHEKAKQETGQIESEHVNEKPVPAQRKPRVRRAVKPRTTTSK